jgi:hypothetical protein
MQHPMSLLNSDTLFAVLRAVTAGKSNAETFPRPSVIVSTVMPQVTNPDTSASTTSTLLNKQNFTANTDIANLKSCVVQVDKDDDLFNVEACRKPTINASRGLTSTFHS